MTRKCDRLNGDLVGEFNRYVLENPSFAARIPRGAEIILQLEGHDGYNAWQRRINGVNHEAGRPVLIVTVRRLAPRRSRVIGPRLKLVKAA